jgi:putative aldouronate transport system substrate-binding protein
MPHYALGNLFLTGLSQNDSPNKWKAFDDYNKTAVKSPILGFFFNSEPIRNELAAVDNVVKQYNSDLIFGRVDPEVMLPEFLAKLTGAGADKIQAEMQKQLDQFLSKKK